LALAIVSGELVPTFKSALELNVPLESLTIILFTEAETITACHVSEPDEP